MKKFVIYSTFVVFVLMGIFLYNPAYFFWHFNLKHNLDSKSLYAKAGEIDLNVDTATDEWKVVDFGTRKVSVLKSLEFVEYNEPQKNLVKYRGNGIMISLTYNSDTDLQKSEEELRTLNSMVILSVKITPDDFGYLFGTAEMVRALISKESLSKMFIKSVESYETSRSVIILRRMESGSTILTFVEKDSPNSLSFLISFDRDCPFDKSEKELFERKFIKKNIDL